MQYRVICGGILKANGELVHYDTILEEGELAEPEMRVKEGYVEVVKGSDKPKQPAKEAKAPDTSEAEKQAAIDKQAEIDAAVKKALEDKQAEIDAQNAEQKVGETSAADLLAKSAEAIKAK